MRGFNCCICNHPCPLFCPGFTESCSENIVVNPIITENFGFFNNTAVGAVEPQAIIPVAFVQGRGTSITGSTTTVGAVNLLPGTYEVTYFAEGTVPESGTISIQLELNGIDVVGSTISATLPADTVTTLTQTIVITVAQTSTLELVNNSTDSTTFTNASIFIRRL